MNRRSTIIRVKRSYDEPKAADGKRILVGRLLARWLTKEKANVDAWMTEIAPSTELRNWYGHEAGKWPEFQARYAKELQANPEGVATLLREVKTGVVTLLYSSKGNRFNNAVALKAYLESMIEGSDQ